MPGGLPEVSQKFSADASGYIAGISAMIAANKNLVADIAKTKAEIDALGVHKQIKITADTSDAMAKIAALKAELDSLGDHRVSIGGDNGAMIRELRDISASMDQVTSSLGRMEDHMVIMKRDLADSSADLMQQTQILRDNADAHNAAADAVAAHSVAHQNASRAVYVPGGGGGGSGGGGGGGGGGGLGFYGSGAFVPWRGGGFQAIKFWGMAIAEFAATAVPALIAAGAASAVGMKGAEDTILRAKAIATTATALGPAYGVTTGSYLGLSGTLGRAQAADRGGVYELAGAGINFLNAGSGAFSQLGTSTLAMIDRGTANMLLNYKARQAKGGGVGDMLGGGTEWLRRYGDLFSNLGNTVLNLAPYEPGLGGDVLNTLVGGTGFLKQATQDIPGPILGAIMAVEGGQRWSKALLSGKGLLGRALGLRKAGGIGGLIGKAGGALAERAPLGSALEGLGFGLSGAGGALAEFGGPIGDTAALSAYTLAWLASTMPTASMRQVAGLQAGIGQAGFSAAFHPLARAIVTTTGLAGGLTPAQRRASAEGIGAMETTGELGRFGPGQFGPTPAGVYQNAATGFAQTQADLINAGPQLVSALKKAGLNSVSMADAFQIAQNALLDTTHAFGKDGKLNKTAVQMLENYGAAIKPMTQTGGAFNAVVGAQQIMGSPQMKTLSQVNQAMDSMIQIASGGPAGMATLFGMLGGTPTTVSHGGMKLSPPPAVAAMAKALTSFTSAGGASAWNTFAGSQGLVAAEQQNLDQLRTYMTLGAIGSRGAAGIAGFQLQQLLPMAKQSPAALAMLMQQAAGIGIGGYYDQSKSQAANYAAFQKQLGGQAFDQGGLTRAMNQAVIRASNIPAMASQFVQGVSANLQAKQVAQASADVMRLRQAAAHGTVAGGAAQDLAGVFGTQGLHGGALKASVDAALKQAGISQTMRIRIEAQVTGLDKLNALKSKQVSAKVNVEGAGELRHLQAQIAALKSKNVQAAAHAQGAGAVAALNAEIAALHSKEVTITTRMITIGGMAGVTPGIPAGVRAPGMQTGGMVPGSGSGDIIPAMLEPGEAIIPRYLVPLIAPILAAHKVPGFGGVPQTSASHFAVGGMAGGGTITGGIGHQFAYTLVDEITKALKSAGAQKIANALVSKLSQEVQYAKQTASGIKSGVNLAGMDLSQGDVLGQLQNYAVSSQSFAKDLGTLRKQHLAKGLISQIVAAGPVQGDALAQSILGTGVKGVNQVWGQIGRSANAIGAQAAMSQYGNYLAPNLRSASVTQNHVSININAKGSGGLNLSPADIKALVAQVQAALLKQAKRNPRTGLQLSGKGA